MNRIKPLGASFTSVVYLVGFMGTGKTSVGRCLADRLGWAFLDVDEEIEKLTGRTISEIFRVSGEEHFRALESEAIRRAGAGRRTVVALGGGAFCSEENRRVVRATGTSVWLDAPIEVISARCEGDGSRPLFSGRSDMEALLERRRPHYELADIRVEVDNLTVEAVAEQIIRALAARVD